jgi:hypothetical protein
MKHFFLLIALMVQVCGFSQIVLRTDTVEQGYYVPLKSNVASCRLSILEKGNITHVQNLTGNQIPDSLVRKIWRLEPGSVVVYSEITVMVSGSLQKANPVRYVIGKSNTTFALRDPSLPIPVRASEAAQIVLDTNTISCVISIIVDGQFSEYAITGNTIPVSIKAVLDGLKPGSRFIIAQILVSGQGSEQVKLPERTYVVVAD